ncbi:MAG: hypothetical protein KBA31_02405 [Alphaproteobacteria bacterium]|nr:hypothetical protein [Alphaproteobacteria bacterium]
MSQDTLKLMLDAADSASTILLSVVGAFFLVANMGAWVKSESIVIPSNSYPSVLVFLLAWLAIAFAYAIAARRKQKYL